LAETPGYLGFDIGGSFVKYGIIDEHGEVLYSSRRPTVLDRGASSLLEVLKLAASEMIQHCAAHGISARAIGVGSPGTIDARSGEVTGQSPNLPGWVGVELITPFAEYNMPVAVDNDANCSAYAEFKYGAARGYKDVVAITLGTGIGSGIILDGKLFHGSHYAGAELGHLSIRSDGPTCGCGNRGCLELYASAAAILRRAADAARSHPDSALAGIDFSAEDDTPLAGVFDAAHKEDLQAMTVLDSVADDLAVGLAGILNAFDPEVLVIGGGAADAAPDYIKIVAEKTSRLTFVSSTRKLRIRAAQLGNKAGFIGAAALGAELCQLGNR